MTKKIAVLVGSLRKESFNRKMAKVLMELAPDSLKLEFVDISQLSFYNEDLEENPPQEWTEFRQHIKESYGILFLTPEYNRSVPAILKNAIDVGSRPYGKSVWSEKPAGIVSVSIGAVGGFGANHHLRQMLVTLNVPTMATPEAYIGNAAKLFNEQGQLIAASTKELMQKFIHSFENWVDLTSPHQADVLSLTRHLPQDFV